MRRLSHCLLLAFAAQAPAIALAEPPKVAFRVVCDDDAASQLIAGAIRAQFEAAGLQTTGQFPFKKLFVYAQRDVGSVQNKDGWTFAVAHATNASTYVVASKLMPSEDAKVEEIKPTLISMVREEGFLSYMNTVHIDSLTPSAVSTVAESVVGDFVKRLPK